MGAGGINIRGDLGQKQGIDRSLMALQQGLSQRQQHLRIGQRGAALIIQRRGDHGIADTVKLRLAHAGSQRAKAATVKLTVNRSPRVEQCGKFGNRSASAFGDPVDLAQTLAIGKGGLSLPGHTAGKPRGAGDKFGRRRRVRHRALPG